MGKIFKVLGIIFVVIIVIGVIAGMGSGSKKVGTNPDTTTTQTSAGNNQPTQEVYKVGDKVQMGDVILTVNKVETTR